MATANVTLETVDVFDDIIKSVETLMTGKCVELSEEDKVTLSNWCHRLNDLASAIQSGHDKWVREIEQDANEDSPLKTIRKAKGSNSKSGGFVTL